MTFLELPPGEPWCNIFMHKLHLQALLIIAVLIRALRTAFRPPLCLEFLPKGVPAPSMPQNPDFCLAVLWEGSP